MGVGWFRCGKARDGDSGILIRQPIDLFHFKIPSLEQRVEAVFRVWHLEFRLIIAENLETA
jgi:hypothetical protein